MSIYSIYKVTNLVNNKIYIGFDSNWPSRKKGHKKSSFNPNAHSYNVMFHCAIRKYGWENFKWELIYQSKDGEHCLNTMETHFIKENDSICYNGKGYNMSFGGDGNLGYRHTEQTKKIMSEKRKGVSKSEDHKKKISKSHKGKSKDHLKHKWLITKPSGETVIINDLTKFCLENKLTKPLMIVTSKGKQTHHKGYKCVNLTTSSISNIE